MFLRSTCEILFQGLRGAPAEECVCLHVYLWQSIFSFVKARLTFCTKALARPKSLRYYRDKMGDRNGDIERDATGDVRRGCCRKYCRGCNIGIWGYDVGYYMGYYVGYMAYAIYLIGAHGR